MYCVFVKMKEEFEKFAEKAKTLPESTSNESKLILYGLYKKATAGPVTTGESNFCHFEKYSIFGEDSLLSWHVISNTK